MKNTEYTKYTGKAATEQARKLGIAQCADTFFVSKIERGLVLDPSLPPEVLALFENSRINHNTAKENSVNPACAIDEQQTQEPTSSLQFNK
jgi:hypothetical protein